MQRNLTNQRRSTVLKIKSSNLEEIVPPKVESFDSNAKKYSRPFASTVDINFEMIPELKPTQS